MKILIIGGTRNMGYFLAEQLHASGHAITLLNRGVTQDNLPKDIARLRADRTDIKQVRRALGGRQFDAVVDMVVFRQQEAEDIINVLDGQTGHYIFFSTGQVYLVREGIQRPYTEADYHGDIMRQPDPNTYDYEEWLYGVEKRSAEAAYVEAFERNGFPYTSLRMPMVNSERDGFKRLYSYVLRIKDGGPVLVPDAPRYPVRNVYAGDVVNAVQHIIENKLGIGKAYNLSDDQTVSLTELLNLLGEIMGIKPDIKFVERDLLMANGFLPDCSPFSDYWMSELDNSLGKAELGISYTPLRQYLEKILAYYDKHPPEKPTSYRRRHAEKNLLIDVE